MNIKRREIRVTRKKYLENKRMIIALIEIRRRMEFKHDNMLTIQLLCGDYRYYKGIEISYKNTLSVRELAKMKESIRVRIEE